MTEHISKQNLGAALAEWRQLGPECLRPRTPSHGRSDLSDNASSRYHHPTKPTLIVCDAIPTFAQ